MRDLTKYNYDELVARITEAYKDKDGSGNGYGGSTGQMLVELLADVTDNLHFMLERRSQESFSSIARLESSVWMAASSVGYVPRRNVSARGTLLLTLKDIDDNTITAEHDIFIRKGEVVKFEEERFIVASDAKIEEGESSTEIEIMEGISKTASFNFSEEPYKTDNYVSLEGYPQVEEFSLVVTEKNGEEYIYVNETDVTGVRFSALSFVPEDFPAYDIRFSRDGMRIVFGKGNFGRSPSNEIELRWIESKGSDVSIIQTGLDFELENETIQDSRGTLPAMNYFYTLTNTSTVSGGADFETIEEIRENLAAFIRSNNRAVTNFDYSFWARRSGIGNLADVKIYGEHETNRLIFTMNNVYVSYATNDGLDMNPVQIEHMRNYLDRMKHITAHLVFRPVDRINLALDVTFKRHPSLPISNSQLYRVVVDRINDYFKVGRGSIGKEFQHSEFVEYLQNLNFLFNGINYPMTDFVKVKVNGMVEIDIPQPSYDGVIEVADDFSISANLVWTVSVDGVPYTVVTSSTDSVKTMVDKMQAQIFSGTSLMVARPSDRQIRLRHPLDTGTFTVSVGSGDLSSDVTFKQYISLPRPSNAFNPNVNQLLPDSVSIVDSSGNTIMEDNGDGFLISPSYATIEIDYSDCRFQTPSIPANQYYMAFQQNQYQNFDITDEGIIGVMPFKEQSDESDVHFFSTLTLI